MTYKTVPAYNSLWLQESPDFGVVTLDYYSNVLGLQAKLKFNLLVSRKINHYVSIPINFLFVGR